MNIRNFFSNLRNQFFPKRTATVQAAAPVQRPHSGMVQTVISRSDTNTGVKQPISTTPARFQQVGAPVTNPILKSYQPRSTQPSVEIKPIGSRVVER